jgi:uncharacterized protein
MQISLQRLNQEKDHQLMVSELISMDSLQAEVPGLIKLDPLQVQARIIKLDPHLIEADVQQSTRATFVCSRCLMEFETSIHLNWVEQFTDVEHRVIETDEQEIHLIEGNELDLDPYIREALLLHIPYAPICQEDCKGLCPKCGVNKNVVSCNCQIETIDPRLAKLQELLNRE